ncbi:MAG: MarR family winged helix-turn-helix transcriptional regulator [Acidimicrobiales bacterium]|jgi:MarR family transcriptional regulator, transcriptional regulator for hemolysin
MYRATRDDPLTKRLAFLGKEIHETFAALLADHGCTMPTWAVLAQAHRNPGLSQVHLAAQIGIEGPTLARHLDKLSADGLVERHRDANDRRILRVALTPKGQRRWEELKDIRSGFDERLTIELTDEHKAALDVAIETIHRALEDAHDPVHTDR